MPYISAKDDRREKLRNGEPALTAGELNYQIFYYVKHSHYGNWKSIKQYRDILANVNEHIKVFVNQFLGEKPNYQKYNDLTGCLVRCAKEIKRRLYYNADFLYQLCDNYDNEIAKYEDTKIKQNGDVE